MGTMTRAQYLNLAIRRYTLSDEGVRESELAIDEHDNMLMAA